MINPTCPNCHRQMVVLQPQFCPYCNFSFRAPAAPPPMFDPANPYAETPPARNVQQLAPPQALFDRPLPTTNLVLNRPQGLAMQTSSGRALAITGGLIVVALIVVAVLVSSVSSGTSSADAALSQWLTGIAYGTVTASQGALYTHYNFYTTFMDLLITVAPMAAVVAYWFSLRRLFQEWAPWVWLKTIVLSYGFILVALLVLGPVVVKNAPNNAGAFGQFSRDSISAFLGAFPNFYLFLFGAAVISSIVGIGFGYFFARWPIERIRTLRSNVFVDLLLTFAVGFGTLLVQYLIYETMDGGLTPFTQGYWWAPAGAIIVAAAACWAALRPATKGTM
jgi:hypothetical protein